MLQQPRPIRFRTKLEILKQRPLQMVMSAYLIGFATMFGVISLFLSSSFNDPTLPEIDYDNVKSKGKLVTGKVTGVEIKENVTINNAHPAVIHYTYPGDVGTRESRYEVLDPKNVERLEAGDPIQVRYLGNESILEEFKTNSFEFIWILATMPIIMIVVGLIFLIPTILAYRQTLALYRTGSIRKAELVSMMPKSGFSMFSDFGQRILIHYKYTTLGGHNLLGESLTTDFSILNDKKQGEQILIFVSQENESRSCLIPKIESLRNDWQIEQV